MINIRTGGIEDLEFLVELEEKSFPGSRRADRRSIANSIASISQHVLVAEVDGIRMAAAVLQLFKNSLRIYSIAVMPEFRKNSIGGRMMDYIIDFARSKGFASVSLEADSSKEGLIKWYGSYGFKETMRLEDYYTVGEHAVRMVLQLDESAEKAHKKIKRNIVVTNIALPWLEGLEKIEIISARRYINDEKYQSGTGVRIFNLCTSYEYQSMGYYVSLLAAARDQRVIPNVTTIKDFSDARIIKSIGEEIFVLMQEQLADVSENEFMLKVYFGQTLDKIFAKLGKSLYRLFEAPFLEFSFERTSEWILRNVSAIPLEEVSDIENIEDLAYTYFNQKRFNITRFKDYKYDLAILVDPDEANPPSCKTALMKFKAAAEKIGFYVDYIGKDDYARLGEYDALFIRSTTDVNNYTYQFSRFAYAEGLIVIDDPWSILKCSNKLYLAERMRKGAVLTPKSRTIGKFTRYSTDVSDLNYPVILKKPDSAFSIGVHKAEDEAQLNKLLDVLFETSDLVIAQEYIQSDFDWRIGILDNMPLYACKYFMAANHWQIYNWDKKSGIEFSGGFETLPLEEVPENVIKTALKAASFIGDGLYGVDLKEVGGKVYLIEVNDNPSIEAGVEDEVLGGKLYMKIMQSIYNRIENSRNTKRLVSN
ncbi:MAG: GNAT family N-acetyltransferase [Clostridia bacterium]|nr:GNAT family N-acetyltransferase [Clostridia bacterium]